MRKFWIPVILSLVVGAIVSAQSLIESATAAAGGSAAGVAGKQVSDGLDKVFGKMGEVTKKAASTGVDSGLRKTAPSAPPVPEVRLPGQPATASSPAGSPPRTPGRRQAANRTPATSPTDSPSAPTPQPAVNAAPPALLPTLDDLKSLAGASREEVQGKMGKPASRITMSDDDGLVEIVSFKGEGGKLGSLRMVNGRVTEVRPAVQ